MIELKGTYNQDCKIFIDEVETEAIELIRNILNQEISTGVQVRIMPDTHVGKGIVIGFTMPVTRMVNPNYIGVDIGCSVTTFKLNQRIEEERFPTLDHAIRRSIPMGMHIRKEKNLDDWWITPYFETVNNNLHAFQQKWFQRFGETKDSIQVDKEYISRLCKKIGIKESTFYCSVGTLGGGNHFIEIDQASDGTYYLVIHSGSRNLGKQVAEYYQQLAVDLHMGKEEYFAKRDEIIKTYKASGRRKEIQEALKELKKSYKTKVLSIPEDLCWLYGEFLEDYLHDVEICQSFAKRNREKMAEIILERTGMTAEESFHTIHNYIDTEEMILRKGAIAAHKGEKVLIPVNMRDGSILAIGKGNKEWNDSAPHGAGRLMSRTKAKDQLDMQAYKESMKGIYTTSVNEQTLDEAPMAYKSLEDIIDVVRESVDVVEVMKPVFNFKAS